MPRQWQETARGRVGRPISPAVTIARLEALHAALKRQEGRGSALADWTDAELRAAEMALVLSAGLFQNEQGRRTERDDD